MSIQKAGELVDHIKECVQTHGATPHTSIYVRQGENGPMQKIEMVKMFADGRGTAILLQTSQILLS